MNQIDKVDESEVAKYQEDRETAPMKKWVRNRLSKGIKVWMRPGKSRYPMMMYFVTSVNSSEEADRLFAQKFPGTEMFSVQAITHVSDLGYGD